MKQKILTALQTKFQGVDVAILSRIADKKAVGVTDESQVPTIVEGVDFQDVLTSYGDFRAGDATTSAVKNYERKHNLKDGKPVVEPSPNDPPAPPPAGGDTDAPAWAKSLIDANKKLEEKLTAFEADKARQVRSEQIKAKAKEHGIPENLVPMLNIAEDEDLDSYFKDAKQTFTNLGFKEIKAPEAGAGGKTDVDSLASLISQGTKEIVEQGKK